MKVKFAIFLLLAFFLVACDNASQDVTQQKVCVVDLARLMRESAPGKEGMKFIENLQQDMQKELDAIQDRLEKNPQDTEAMQQLQTVYSLSQQRIQADGQAVASQVLDVVQRELNSFLEQNGYAYILATEALATYDQKLDMTNEVLKRLENQKVEFKIMQPPVSGKAEPVEEATKALENGQPAQDESSTGAGEATDTQKKN